MEETQEQKYICKFCNKCCDSGKSLGGHMRGHLALISAAKKQKDNSKVGSEEKEEEEAANIHEDLSISEQSESSTSQEKENNVSIGDDGDDSIGYGLRENPRRSWRVSDFKNCSLEMKNLCKECGKEFFSMKALAGHLRTHSKKGIEKCHICEKCGKGFASMRALFGHMKVHSKRSRVDDQDSELSKQSLSDFDNICPIRKKRSKIKYKIDVNSSFSGVKESSSAISEVDEVEEAARCLLMLSVGVRDWDEYISVLENSKNENVILESESSFHCAKGISAADAFTVKHLSHAVFSDSGCVDDYEKNYEIAEFSDELMLVNTEITKVCYSTDMQFENDPSSSVVMEDFPSLNSCPLKNAGVDFHPETNLLVSEPVKSKKHKCPVCFKVFPSGQSLGGHKRAHYTGFTESKTKEPMVKKLDDLADNHKAFDLNTPVNAVDVGENDVELKLCIVTSLLRRIAALESSLRRTSSPPRTRQTLRDAAARTIQTHFRAFLARRSRTLRLLKQLASIKTTLYVLKSLVSGKTHFDARAVKHKALDLLVRLDSIEGDDPLIRDGKRSISNELARFVKAINGVTIISSRVVKNVGGGYKARVFSTDRKIEFDTNRSEAIDKFVASVNESEDEEEEEEDQQNTRLSDTEKSGILPTRCGGLAGSHGGVKPKRKKSVTFAENGGAYRVFHSSPEPASVGNVHEKESFDDEIELIKNLNKRVEKLGMASKDCQVAEQEDSESSGSSDNERDPNQISRKDGYYERNVRDENDNEIENESFLFSAPLPVKMEGRAADHINRKKGVKIVGN
ncbi:hypothetical protein T459_07047 [Capsicum annuum]|uniref:C2H2-type domain-containing protein n=1 Tax=Capsicum annuum TaxID=4072 RepID=A0A2G3ACH3_CAPAN|nr:hypothetical protein T459_07047 [Capsicum annuum]